MVAGDLHRRRRHRRSSSVAVTVHHGPANDGRMPQTRSTIRTEHGNGQRHRRPEPYRRRTRSFIFPRARPTQSDRSTSWSSYIIPIALDTAPTALRSGDYLMPSDWSAIDWWSLPTRSSAIPSGGGPTIDMGRAGVEPPLSNGAVHAPLRRTGEHLRPNDRPSIMRRGKTGRDGMSTVRAAASRSRS